MFRTGRSLDWRQTATVARLDLGDCHTTHNNKQKFTTSMYTAGVKDVTALLAAIADPRRTHDLVPVRDELCGIAHRFADIARLACRVSRSPMAAATFVDADRVVVLAAHGWPEVLDELPLSDCFCAHTVALARPIVVNDARRDEVFHKLSMVRALGVMAYIGVPVLHASGRVLGTVCAFDRERREWREDDIEALRDVGELMAERIRVHTRIAELEREAAAACAMRDQDRERRPIEEALRRDLAELESIYESAPVGLCVLDRDLRYVRINERLAQMNGISVAEHLGHSVQEVVPEVAPALIPALERLLETGEPVRNLEIRGETRAQPGVARIWVETWCPLKDMHGTVVGVNIVAEDVTEHRLALERLARHEQELAEKVESRTAALTEAARRLGTEMRRREEAQAALAQSQKLEAVGQLTGGIAHDFNNVLAAVSGALHVLNRTATLPVQREFVERGLHAVDRASRLIAQLMAFTRKSTFSLEPHRARDIVKRAVALIEQALGARAQLDAAVECEWVVSTDAHQLELALLNLAINARDAMPEGGTVRVRCFASSAHSDRPAHLSGDCVVFEVEDSGLGMSPEILAKACDPFFTTKASGRGTGLGLAMVQSFAQRAGGALSLSSTLGVGTTARIYLPRSLDPAPAEFPVEAAIDLRLHGNATVVLADDDNLVRPVIALYLRELGYQVIEARNAIEAIALIESNAPVDLLISDVVMPGLDGVDLVRAVRAAAPELPVLLVSGYPDALDVRGEFFLAKPFSATRLAATVAKALRRDEQLLLERIRSPQLRTLCEKWQSIRQRSEVPPYNAQTRAAFVRDDFGLLVEVVDNMPFRCRLIHVGGELATRLGREPSELIQPFDRHVLEGLEAAYRQCARSGEPGYEWLVLRMGQDKLSFERLLLPFKTEGAEHVTHLIGYVTFADGGSAQR